MDFRYIDLPILLVVAMFLGKLEVEALEDVDLCIARRFT
jgi:hypothetical protein